MIPGIRASRQSRWKQTVSDDDDEAKDADGPAAGHLQAGGAALNGAMAQPLGGPHGRSGPLSDH